MDRSCSIGGRALVLAIVLGCGGGGMSAAKSDFKRGDVAEAKEKLVALEAREAGWAPPARAEYALYRGLVHHALGDRDAARRWLERVDRRVLSEDDRARLDLALEAVGGIPSAPAPR